MRAILHLLLQGRVVYDSSVRRHLLYLIDKRRCYVHLFKLMQGRVSLVLQNVANYLSVINTTTNNCVLASSKTSLHGIRYLIRQPSRVSLSMSDWNQCRLMYFYQFLWIYLLVFLPHSTMPNRAIQLSVPETGIYTNLNRLSTCINART